MRRALALAFALALGLAGATPAWAWLETGHRLTTIVGIEALPADVPAFLHTPAVMFKLAELSREPDRSRRAGPPHDNDLDPGHFVLADDQGRVAGGPGLDALPADRDGYETALRAVGSSSWKAGWVPYNIADGYQQLVKDFGYWRADKVGEKTGKTLAQRLWFARDRALREDIIVRDLGYWSHFVADGSQPMHASIHYDGWGAFPNPDDYTQDQIHLAFEGDFVSDNVDAAAIRARLRPYRSCGCTPLQAAGRYLGESRAEIEPLFKLWAAGAFKGHDPRGTAFVVERLAAGASELRDQVTDAWRESGTTMIGFGGMTVDQVEKSGVAPYADMHGRD